LHPFAFLAPLYTTMEELDQSLSRLITAFHILHNHKVLDERGQISIRNPQNPSTFFTSNVPPILVSSKNDIVQWNVADGSKAFTSCKNGYADGPTEADSEHFIHSCIYARFPGVKCVIHSHCSSIIVYGLCNSSGSMMQPAYQMAGFLGQYLPIFDAATHYPSMSSSLPQNLMVNQRYLGDALAEKFCASPGTDGSVEPDKAQDLPFYSVVLQRGHGFVACAESLEAAVFKAIHLTRNAKIQTMAMVMRFESDLEVVYLSKKEAKDCETTLGPTVQHSWSAWATEVTRSHCYRNDLRSW